MGRRIEIHDRVLEAKSTKDLMSAYGEWADRYDNDLIGEYGYVAPAIMARMLLDTGIDSDAEILDAGCGTGLVSVELAKAGCTQIDGLDYSPEMLSEARRKGTYRDLIQADLNTNLEIPDKRYDAVVCVGTFTTGHVGADALDELLRVAKPGAPICFTVRHDWWEASSFAGKAAALEDQLLWKQLALEDVDYIRKEGARCQAALFRRLN